VRTLTSEVREKEKEKEKEQQQIDWRRSQVLELASQGYNQREICQKLQLDKSAVSRDIQFINKQAQETIQKHIHETIPAEYQRCLTGINQVLKMAWSIVDKDIDNKTRLQALTLINDCNKYKMDLATGSAVCNEALKFVTQKKEQIDTLQKIDERIEEIEEEEKTTNGIF
jgi:hypothetical protein